MPGTVHVIGAGLAGLSAAVRLAGSGRRIKVYEAAPQAGGRCRSYFDPVFHRTIDNGNHLLLSGNELALDYLARIGSARALQGLADPVFDFADLATGQRWTLRLDPELLPRWILDPDRRVPGSAFREYLAPIRLIGAGSSDRLSDVMACSGPLYDRLWRPLLLAALNTEPDRASARLAWRLLRRTVGAGGRACRPLIAKHGLSAAFVDSALDFLAGRNAEVAFGTALRAIALGADRAQALQFDRVRVPLRTDDRIVLAVPARAAAALLPGLTAPDDFSSIINAHFAIAPPPGHPSIVGIISGLSQWLFAYEDRLSVTISDAGHLLATDRAGLASAIWREVAGLTGLPKALPSWRIVKERRATIRATPEQEARRPPQHTPWANVVLAGDWTATGLPGTIEGAIQSGYRAASIIAEQPWRLRPRIRRPHEELHG